MSYNGIYNDNKSNIEENLDGELEELDIINDNMHYLYTIGDEMEESKKKDIWDNLHELIRPHFNYFSEELEQYFSKFHQLSGFDMEGGDRPYLAMGITISGANDFEIWGDFPSTPLSFNGMVKLENSNKKFQNVVHSLVAFGLNGKESELIRSANVPIHDAQKISQIQGKGFRTSGIHYVEKVIGFKRQGCSFYKHKYTYRKFNLKKSTIYRINKSQIYHSLWNHYRGASQRYCRICSKPQDVLLYCLEDALSACFIYIYYQNRHPEKFRPLYSDKNTFKKKVNEKINRAANCLHLIGDCKKLADKYFSNEIAYEAYFKKFATIMRKAHEQGHENFTSIQKEANLIEFNCSHCDLTLFCYGRQRVMKLEDYIRIESKKNEMTERLINNLHGLYSARIAKFKKDIEKHPEQAIHYAGMVKQIEWMRKNVINKQNFHELIISEEDFRTAKAILQRNDVLMEMIPVFKSKILSDIIFCLNEKSS